MKKRTKESYVRASKKRNNPEPEVVTQISTEVIDDGLPVELFLDKDDMMEMLWVTEKSNNAKLEEQLVTGKIIQKSTELEKVTLEEKVKKYELQELQQSVGVSKNKSSLIKTEYVNLAKKLENKYKLPSKWGFDPDTRKIIIITE